MLAQFSIYPMRSEHMSQDVARAIETLEATGLDYRLGPLSTAVEGSWDEVMSAIRKCHEAVAQHHDRVVTTIVIDHRSDDAHHLDQMITSVERQLGRSVKH